MTRRVRGSGSVYLRQDGRWAASRWELADGKYTRRTRYAGSEQEALARLDEPVAAHMPALVKPCTGCRRSFPIDDLHHGQCGGCFPWGRLTSSGARFPARPDNWRSFICAGCQQPTVTSSASRAVCVMCETDRHWRRREQRGRAARRIGRHTNAEWVALVEAWGGTCAYCGTTGRLTKDHVVPISRGGSDLIENITPACGRCNASKHDRPAREFARRRSA